MEPTTTAPRQSPKGELTGRSFLRLRRRSNPAPGGWAIQAAAERALSGVVLLVLLGLVWPPSEAAARQEIYCDSETAAEGDGSMSSPYRRMSNINWQAIGGWLAAGEPVSIKLKRGSQFWETLDIKASGGTSAQLVVEDYGEGRRPIIRGDGECGPWIRELSSTNALWQAVAEIAPQHLWANGQRLAKGSQLETLLPGQWFWQNGLLFLRAAEQAPDQAGYEVRKAIRNHALLANSRTNILIKGLDLSFCASYAARFVRCQGVVLEDCLLRSSDSLLHCDSTDFLSLRSCHLTESYRNYSVNVSGAGSSLEAFFCLFEWAEASGVNLQVFDGARASLVNCNLVGAGNRHVLNSSTGTVSLANCIVAGTGISPAITGNEVLLGASNAIFLQNSLVLPNGQNPALLFSGVQDLGGNLFEDPRFAVNGREGLFVITEDDLPTAKDWADLADLAELYGFRTTLSLSETHALDAATRNLLQARINRGHEIASHTRSHADLTQLGSIRIRYLGAGTRCRLWISNQVLRTAVEDGPLADHLFVDLQAAVTDTQSKLINQLNNHPAYQSEQVTTYNHRVPARLLAETVVEDLKNNQATLSFSANPFYDHEIRQSKLDIESKFLGPTGAPYQCRALNYPGGYFNETVTQELMAAGFLSARTAGQAGSSWHLSDLDVYALKPAPLSMFGLVLLLTFESNTRDQSLAGNHFSPTNLSFSGDSFRLSYAASFNGSNSYAWRSNGVPFDFSSADWLLSAALKPGTAARQQTLFFMGESVADCFRWDITPEAGLSVVMVSNGVSRAVVSAPAGSLQVGAWQKVTLWQRGHHWVLRVGNNLWEASHPGLRLPRYSGSVLLGCALDGAGQPGADGYAGLLDDLSAANGTWMRTHAVLDALTQAGGIYCALTHGESSMPREIWRVVLEAIKNYSGPVRVMTQSEAVEYLRRRSNMPVNARRLSGNPPRRASFVLRPDSPCIGAANPASLIGLSNLRDLAGNVITLADGRLVEYSAPLSMGAYLWQPAVASPVGWWPTNLTVSLVGVDQTALAINPLASSNQALVISLFTNGALAAAQFSSFARWDWPAATIGLQTWHALVAYQDGSSCFTPTNQLLFEAPRPFYLRWEAQNSHAARWTILEGNADREYEWWTSTNLRAWRLTGDTDGYTDGRSFSPNPKANDSIRFFQARIRPR